MLTASSEEILRGLPQMIEELIERQRRLDGEAETPDATIDRRSLRKLTDFSASEQRELEAAIRRLGREMHGAPARRLRPARSGRISVAHTLRQNLRYEGIPFRPVLRRRREDRPRLVVLCDVSLSTRMLARFWLHMIREVQGLFSKVRTFVFVDDVAEVTQLLEESTFEEAVRGIFGGGLIDADVNSDFGRALEEFRLAHLDAVNRRTTVVILGDGRNNGRPPGDAALEDIARRARRVVWMTPEPKWSWALGGCDMRRYQPLCDRVEVVRNVDDLGGVVDHFHDLIRREHRPRGVLANGLGARGLVDADRADAAPQRCSASLSTSRLARSEAFSISVSAFSFTSRLARRSSRSISAFARFATSRRPRRSASAAAFLPLSLASCWTFSPVLPPQAEIMSPPVTRTEPSTARVRFTVMWVLRQSG